MWARVNVNMKNKVNALDEDEELLPEMSNSAARRYANATKRITHVLRGCKCVHLARQKPQSSMGCCKHMEQLSRGRITDRDYRDLKKSCDKYIRKFHIQYVAVSKAFSRGINLRAGMIRHLRVVFCVCGPKCHKMAKDYLASENRRLVQVYLHKPLVVIQGAENCLRNRVIGYNRRRPVPLNGWANAEISFAANWGASAGFAGPTVQAG